MRLRAGVVAATVAAALGLGGCGSATDTTPSDDADDPYRPTGTPSATVAMGEGPAAYSEVEGSGFTISAPGEFQQQRTTSRNGEPMLVLETPSRVTAVPQRVVVIRDTAPRAPATQQSFALETLKSSSGTSREVHRTSVPGLVDELPPAILVSWRERRAGAGASTVEVTYWQLFQQVGDDLILNVVALAPTAEFETSEVSRILRTFVPDTDG
ncbi:hypothetical protein ABFT23_00145 [Nocardioides sp. C4-1]|uniref:hypothetical protein n=1 Tax=Nocardioides sp. C4-1 TaxID=3151851 RepID=UPI00326603D4